jgi:hypothetical protein
MAKLWRFCWNWTPLSIVRNTSNSPAANRSNSEFLMPLHRGPARSAPPHPR